MTTPILGTLHISVNDPSRHAANWTELPVNDLEVIDGLISMYDGHRGYTDDDTGPGKTVYVVISLTANETGQNWPTCPRPGAPAGR